MATPNPGNSAASTADPAPAPLSVIASAQRLAGFDIVRAAAAMSVIWVHIGRSAQWRDLNLSAAGSWGTAFLNTLAGFFVVWALKKRGARDAPRFALHRIWRLYGSFLIWCGIYLLARAANYLLFHKVSALVDPGRGLEGAAKLKAYLFELGPLAFFGTTYHLWFLPYLLIITLLTLPLVAWAVRTRESMLIGGMLFALAAMALLLAPEPWWVTTGDLRFVALAHIYLRSPGYLTGLAFGLWTAAGLRPRLGSLDVLACMGVIALAMYLSLTTELPRHILNRIAATAAFLIALGPWQSRAASAFGKLGQLGFGVYLCHVLFVEGFYACANSLHLAPSMWVDLGVFALSVVFSFLTAYLLRKVRWLAWTIP